MNYLKIDWLGQMVHDWAMLLKLTDEQWARIWGHVPEESIPPSRPGRHLVPVREVLNAALWVLATGVQWHMLPYRAIRTAKPPTGTSSSGAATKCCGMFWLT